MPENNKSALVGNNSIHAANPLTMADIHKFAKAIAYKITTLIETKNTDFEVKFGDYVASVAYRVSFREMIGGDSYCGIYETYTDIASETTEVVDVFHTDGTPHPGICYALNQMLQ